MSTLRGIRSMKNVLILVLLMSLSGCWTRIVYKDKEICTAPSPYLLVPINSPDSPNTYKDYVAYRFQADAQLAICNARLEAINKEYLHE